MRAKCPTCGRDDCHDSAAPFTHCDCGASWAAPLPPLGDGPRHKRRRSPFERAIEFGRVAFRDGLPRDANPYPDTRKACGRLTWSRAWRRAWLDGWEQAARERSHAK
jgi:hypothetical protein